MDEPRLQNGTELFVMPGAARWLFAYSQRARGVSRDMACPQSAQSFDRLFSGRNTRILLLPAARGTFMARNTSFAGGDGRGSLPCSGGTLHSPAYRPAGRAC